MNLPVVLRREVGLQFEGSDTLFFLYTGVTLPFITTLVPRLSKGNNYISHIVLRTKEKLFVFSKMLIKSGPAVFYCIKI